MRNVKPYPRITKLQPEQPAMSDPLSLLSSVVSILGLWIAFDAGYRPYRVDVLRNRLLQLRSDLFEVASQGRLGARGLRDVAYLRIRRRLNGFIRYGHQFTLFRLFVLFWSSRWWLDAKRVEERRGSLVRAISTNALPGREELRRITREAEYAIVIHMISVSFIGFIFLRVGECIARILRMHHVLKDRLSKLIEENRRLLAPIEEDATWGRSSRVSEA